MPKAQKIIENQADVQAELLQRQLAEAHNVVQNLSLKLEEGMSNLSLSLENVGWTELSQYNEEGPELGQVQDAAKKLRNLTGLNAHMGRGARIRHANIWSGGIHHTNIPEGGRQGVPNVKETINHPLNQANFFGAAARERQEKACYTAGRCFVIGHEAKGGSSGRGKRVAGTPKTLQPLPISQISAAYINPDDPNEIWAVRRSWSADNIQTANGLNTLRSDVKHEWIYLNRHVDKRAGTIPFGGANENVAQDKVLFMEQVNRQDGWTWGLPDAVAAFAWADQYRRGVLSGLKMQDALAQIAYKLKAQTAKGANAAAAKVSNSAEKGSTAAMVEGMDLAPLSSAGQGYDFDSLRPVLAIVATALDVSVVSLSSDPGAAGSSYGSAATLDLPTRLAMDARRQVHAEFEGEILRWLGAKDGSAWFEPLVDGAELYRLMQAIVLKWNTGLYEPEQIKEEFEALSNRHEVSDIPTGVLLPNNEASLERRDIDADGAGVPASTPAANQGVADGAGGDGNTSGNDIRNDNVT